MVRLFGRLHEGEMAYAFLAGLPLRVKELLRANTNVNTLLLGQLLERAQTILRESSVTKSWSSSPHSLLLGQNAGRTCYRCQGYSAKECKRRRARMRCYRCKHGSGNQAGDKTSASVYSPKWLDETLSVSCKFINRSPRTVLLDLDSSGTVVNKGLCWTWWRVEYLWPQ